ncbi:MAG TPA: hypothetical protein VMA75_03425 [Candidatus Paceibacterota bacterium]|nr:hypothetical protein [Candidatus Paceibacterota bacterium]
MWQDWVNFILGIVLIVIAYSAASTTWIAIVGVLIIIFSLWGALGGRKA